MSTVEIDLHLPNRIQYCPVNPFDNCHRFVTGCRFLRFATHHVLDFFMDVFDRANGEVGAPNCFQEILASGIDRDPTLSDDHIDQFTRPDDCCYLIHDHWDAIAKRW